MQVTRVYNLITQRVCNLRLFSNAFVDAKKCAQPTGTHQNKMRKCVKMKCVKRIAYHREEIILKRDTRVVVVVIKDARVKFKNQFRVYCFLSLPCLSLSSPQVFALFLHLELTLYNSKFVLLICKLFYTYFSWAVLGILSRYCRYLQPLIVDLSFSRK